MDITPKKLCPEYICLKQANILSLNKEEFINSIFKQFDLNEIHIWYILFKSFIASVTCDVSYQLVFSRRRRSATESRYNYYNGFENCAEAKLITISKYLKLDSELMGEVIGFVSQNCGLFIFVIYIPRV